MSPFVAREFYPRQHVPITIFILIIVFMPSVGAIDIAQTGSNCIIHTAIVVGGVSFSIHGAISSTIKLVILPTMLLISMNLTCYHVVNCIEFNLHKFTIAIYLKRSIPYR